MPEYLAMKHSSVDRCIRSGDVYILYTLKMLTVCVPSLLLKMVHHVSYQLVPAPAALSAQEDHRMASCRVELDFVKRYKFIEPVYIECK
jgi:hypothetical protein